MNATGETARTGAWVAAFAADEEEDDAVTDNE